ncbi:hypothetical protein EVAR_94786_1 [Eumeta japonica]|uniref:Uncharacterized protein n=1 Tax=Eumeta variegata TaxID=151549 RepID=A0A4C1UH81_EUMVA|nr:hypothetical protein EVAR_94786_1 [Eumeta japonica]
METRMPCKTWLQVIKAEFTVTIPKPKDSLLEDNKTVTAVWYTNNGLPLVLEKIGEKRLRVTILLHYNIASPQTNQQTTKNSGALGTKLLAHSPFLPDLAPCDLYLFLKVRKRRGRSCGRKASQCGIARGWRRRRPAPGVTHLGMTPEFTLS